MKFLLDESVDARLAPFLASLSHDVTVVGHDYRPSIPDTEVLAIAHREQRILITDDRDFGELVFRQRQPHAGVLYFRLPPSTLENKLSRLSHERVPPTYTDQYPDRIIRVPSTHNLWAHPSP